MSAGSDTPRDAAGELEEDEARAAEYVLGTLPADERAAVEAARRSDPTIDAAIRAWERRLAPLDLAIPEAQPPRQAWAGIARRLGGTGTAVNDDRVVALTRQLRRWRAAAGGAGLLAACLALAIALGRSPPAPTDAGRYVAVVTSGGEAPALIVSVDTARGTAEVRPVAAKAPAGRSLELWYIGGNRPPRSLGLLGRDPSRIGLPAEAANGEGVIAVSVEPPGGSQTGQPTGQVIYQGRLIRD